MEDRIIQQCIKQVLEPICEAKFYKHSYGPDIYGFQIKHNELLLQLSTSPNDEGIIQTAKLPY